MRRTHWLRRNARGERPSTMIFVDTESQVARESPTRERHTLWFGMAIYVRLRRSGDYDTYDEEVYRFTTAEEFGAWVMRKTRPRVRVYIFAHNWNFDAAMVRFSEWPARYGLQCVSYVNEPVPFWLEFRGLDRTILVVDTLNWFRSHLGSVARSVGMRKLPMPARDADTLEWDRYCLNDVRIIQAAMLAYLRCLDEHDLGNFQRTIAAQALTAFRHRFMRHAILILSNDAVSRLERAAYYGGRCECMYLGRVGARLYNLDVNSMYPYIMAARPVPTRLRYHRQGGTVDVLRRAMQRHLVIARVTAQTDVPVVPYRHNGRLVFPAGTFEATLCQPELELLLEHGRVLEVHEMAVYDGAVVFRDYVETLYQMRRQYQDAGNVTYALLTKLLLNSLYGKFGQRAMRWVDVRPAEEGESGEWYEIPPDDSPAERYRVRLGLVQRYERLGESEQSFPAISAFITSYGRVLLWHLMELAGAGHVYYTDTDSVIVDDVGYQRLAPYVDDARLGALKVVGTSDDSLFFGAKDYRFGDERRIKGIKRDAEQVDEHTYIQDTWRSWDYTLKEGQDGCIYVDRQPHVLTREYTKGVPTASGWVEPLSLAAPAPSPAPRSQRAS